MWIVNQSRTNICYCNNIWIDNTSFSIRNNEKEMGVYNSLEECQKVFEEIIDSIKYQHLVFNMPKKESK